MKGSYFLIIKLENDSIIQIGKLGEIDFKKGHYLYVGSALNGLEQRIKRHRRVEKSIHWHIDYLLKYAEIINVFYKENEFREECNLAKKLGKKLPFIPGFGCSDCNCESHLFYGTCGKIMEVVDKLHMKNYSFYEKS